jgi:hypothetical protein
MVAHFLEGAVHSREQVLVCILTNSIYIHIYFINTNNRALFLLDMKIKPTNAYADIRTLYIRRSNMYMFWPLCVHPQRCAIQRTYYKSSKTNAKILNTKL